MKILIVLVVFAALSVVTEQRQARHTVNFQRYWSLHEVKFENIPGFVKKILFTDGKVSRIF